MGLLRCSGRSANWRARLSVEKPNIALIGYSKDHSSYYLKLFPQWGAYSVDPHGRHGILSATDIRDALYVADEPATYLAKIRQDGGDFVYPRGTYLLLREWVHTSAFERMRAEQKFMTEYLAQFQRNPYTDEPQTFNTADACIMMAGHTLLVRRGQMPGEGLWAMPGGHVHVHERFSYASAREAIEETGLPMTVEQLLGSASGARSCWTTRGARPASARSPWPTATSSTAPSFRRLRVSTDARQSRVGGRTTRSFDR